MKIKNFLIIPIAILLLTFSSCASKQKAPRERSDTFIADIHSFSFGELHLYTRMTIGAPKISDFALTFIPRSNIIQLNSKISVDYIQLYFSYAERLKLKEAAQKYLNDYENNLIKDEKPTKKNSLYKGSIPLSWGMLGYGHDVNVNCQANIEFLEKDKPYFRLKFESTTDPEDGSITPAFSIYVSPSQWQTIFEMCDQETLETRCDEIIAQAEAF